MQRSKRWSLVMSAVVLVVGVAACKPILPITDIGPVVEGSDRVGCNKADNQITVEVSTHLDGSCTYTRSIQITASNVVFDCRGAQIRKDPTVRDRLGIEIVSPTDEPLINVVVRNCIVRDFFNNMRIRRDGFRDLVQGSEYENGFSDIRVENSRFYDSEASGVFVDAYVTGVTLANIEVARSGGVGVYLEGGSKDNVVENSEIHHNGYGDVTPEGVPIVFNGVEFRYRSTGKQGISIDGARDSIVRNNSIHNNSAGGIFFFKNCGEDVNTNPGGWWHRPYGSSGNLIENNRIGSEKNGVWIAFRMAENQEFMDCSDTPYITEPLRRVYLDPAPGNVVRNNVFVNVMHGVRVEDDGNRIEDNEFHLLEGQTSVLFGTRDRTQVLGVPVSGTVVTGNQTTSVQPIEPYGWAHGHVDTTFSDNAVNGAPATLVEGVQPPINPFLFAIEIWLAP